MYYDTFLKALDSGAFWCILTTVHQHEKSTTYQVADSENHVFPVEIPGTHISSSFVLVLN
jgi:hypothetical protein